MIATNSIIEVSYSDNSHIFGIPIVIKEELDAFMSIKREDLRSWIGRVGFLQGIEFHFSY